jgi:hypothetical protein
MPMDIPENRQICATICERDIRGWDTLSKYEAETNR